MAMEVSIGRDSRTLVREASMAMRPALALSSAVPSLMPSAIFWLGQMMPQTFRNMMMAR